MKKLLIILSIGLMGCTHSNVKTRDINQDYQTVIIDECEYIVVDYKRVYWAYGFMSHKGNCKNHKPL